MHMARLAADELISAVVKRYNTQYAGQPSQRINSDESTALRLIAKTDDTFKRRLRAIWSSGKQAHTAVPLNLLAAPYLLDTATLPVTQRDNPVWFNILTVTKAKLNMWLLRVNGRFDVQVQETIRKGRVPNLRNFASQYRDANPELVWRMSCMFTVIVETVFPTLFAASDRDVKIQNFMRGALDADMKDKAQVLDPTFCFEDLRFIRVAGQAKQSMDWQEDVQTVTSQAERNKLQAELNLIHAKLLGEQTAWSEYTVRRKAITDSTLSDITKAREAAQMALEQAVQHHVDHWYPSECLQDRAKFLPSAEACFRNFCEQLPFTSPEKVLRLDVFNLAALGAQHSQILDALLVYASFMHETHPANSASIFLMPNTPEWGKASGGNLSPKDFASFAALAAEETKTEIKKKAIHHLEAKDIVAMFDEQDFYSPERKLKVDVVMCLSQAVSDTGALLSTFVNSTVWKRDAVPDRLKCWPRSEFKDWSRRLDVMESSSRDANVDRRQWYSGPEFYAKILERTFEGMKLHPGVACHVREHCLYDNTLATACMQLNAANKKNMPTLGWVGMTFNHFIRHQAGLAVKANVHAANCDAISTLVKQGKYNIPGFKPVTVQDVQLSALLPPPPPNLELTVPRDLELPLKQSVLDECNKKLVLLDDSETTEKFNKWVTEHNQRFNQSGVPWKGLAKRPLEDKQENIEQRAITVPQIAGRPQSLDVLKSAGAVHEYPDASPTFKLLAHKGHLFLLGLADDVLSDHKPLFPIKGKFKADAEAKAIMSKKHNYVAFDVTGSSLVTLEVRSTKPSSIGPEPQTLDRLLELLEVLGFTRVKLRMHQVSRQALSTGVLHCFFSGVLLQDIKLCRCPNV